MPPEDKAPDTSRAFDEGGVSQPRQIPPMGQPVSNTTFDPPTPQAGAFTAPPQLNGSIGSDMQTGGSRRFGKKKLVISAIAAAVILLGGSASAYYLGVVVPNKPENLWPAALERSAKAYDNLVGEVQESKDAKGVVLKGDYKVTGDFATDGTYEMQSYEQTATFKADTGVVGSRVNFEGRIVDAANSNNPDVYLKASGIKGVGSMLGQYAELVNQYDNQWISIDHTLFDNLQSMALKNGESSNTVSAALTVDDMTKVAETVGTVNKKYLFTTDADKHVFTVAKQVGKQKDGNKRDVYHYQVALHKQHTKDYLNELVGSLQNTPLTKLTAGKKLRDTVDMDMLIKAIDEYKESDFADVYVDLETKLISQVRITYGADKKSSFTMLQNYYGGDVIPVVITLLDATDSESTMQFSLNYNKKTNAADGNISVDSPAEEQGGQRTKLSSKFTITKNDTKLDVQKPEGAKSIMELLEPLMTGLITSSFESMYDDSNEDTDLPGDEEI